MEFLTSSETFLLDLDGTLYLSGEVLPGACEFVHRLHKSGRSFFYLTNNSSTSPSVYEKKLISLGFPVPPNTVLTSGTAAALFLTRHYAQSRIAVVGTQALRQQLSSAGLSIYTEPSHADVLLMGYDTEITYDKIRWACGIVDRGIPFFATHEDRLCPHRLGCFLPDCGAMTNLITEATGVEPTYLGKPHQAMIDLVFRYCNTVPGKITLVGDRLYTDIAMAHSAKMNSLLVLTGETKLAPSTGRYLPSGVVENLHKACAYI
ncbi:HAD-IIA family hydrolase [Chitinivibrio alkaliphilus]|uniref:N-acetylglucosamine-6-phosphate deacetylase n=1 Tax=Chitinivibrio alkaliphilus ACht1 TaxID=1313304 RepID=U7DAG3_9BACT|nr:HAD-IIA family hydrolase [Chitinivibrio alkaliphilus]ERP32122.1 N-acetylglucosamine-6-phosphate deacetylase [Chitinivibrio alkaliphilus ACht1]